MTILYLLGRLGCSIIFIAVYVDNIILTRDDLFEISVLKCFLDYLFRIKELGLLNYFLVLKFIVTFQVFYCIKRNLWLICSISITELMFLRLLVLQILLTCQVLKFIIKNQILYCIKRSLWLICSMSITVLMFMRLLVFLDITHKLHSGLGDLLPKHDSYRSLIGKLNFLTRARRALCFVVKHLSQFLQALKFFHMAAALHVLST